MRFEELVEPHRRRLRVHCYRMLGSSSDAEDMVQETMVRAFRAQATLEDAAMVRPWLYRIATNACLDELRARGRRMRGPDRGPPSDPALPPASPTPESEWLEPCPTAWLDPDAAYAEKESIALAFVAALQVLTPAQRAVLLLRDVVGLSAEETATALATTVAAANSTLHRARAALEARVGPRASVAPEGAVDRELLERYLRVWREKDLDAIVALLHDEVVLAMPPHPTWLEGRAAVARFFDHRIRHAVESGLFVTRPFEANGQPAVAFYRTRERSLFALHVLEPRDGRVRAIDHFMTERALRACFAAGLPRTV